MGPTASEAKLVTYKNWNDKIGAEINMQQGEKELGQQN